MSTVRPHDTSAATAATEADVPTETNVSRKADVSTKADIPAKTPYHHGDLRATLLQVAMELLEEGEDLSLRAVARRAGVSPAAPYRHYADREALVAAIATIGYRELTMQLASAHPQPSTPDQLAEVAVAYVRFALDRPALFRIMFSEPCDDQDAERVMAIEAISAYVRGIAARGFPQTEPETMGTGLWAVVHGLAFLYLDGKLDADSPDAVAAGVRSTIRALVATTMS